MKKLILVLLLFSVLFSVFAAEKYIFDKRFKPFYSGRTSGMGYYLYENQAALAKHSGLKIQGSAIDLSIYHLTNVMKDDAGSKAISEILKFKAKKKSYTTFVTALAEAAENGNQLPLVHFEENLGFVKNHLAIGLDSQFAIYSYNNTSQVSTTIVQPVLTVSLAGAYGLTIFDDGMSSVNVGASVKPTFRMNNNGENLAKLVDLFTETNKKAFGIMFDDADKAWAVPIDLSLQFSTYYGALDFNFEAANILGDYHYKENGKVSVPLELNAGIMFAPITSKIHPSLNVEFVNINKFIKDDADVSAREFLKYINADIAVDFNGIFNIIGGIHGAYLFTGLSAGFHGNQIEAYYNWSEVGEHLGDNSADAFSIRLRFGYDRNPNRY